MPKIQIFHFNDVYHLKPQKQEPIGGVARFATVVKQFREKYGVENSCVLFSGDAFNPSVPAMNGLGIDVACLGNHDFDFGLPTLKKLIMETKFPWLLSNVLNSETGGPITGGEKWIILEKSGLKIGIIGLVEKEWLETIPGLPPSLEYKDFITVGKELATELRDNHAVDLVIALSHSRLPNDIMLAKECKDEIDLVLGGHDHFYYLGKGCDVVKNWTRDDNIGGSEGDDGVRVVKSGTDFRELTILELDVDDVDNRKKIKTLTATRHEVRSSIEEDQDLVKLIEEATSEITAKMSKPVAYTMTPWDCRSISLRTQETAFGNFVADLMLYAYQPCISYNIDCAILCGGCIRSDLLYPPGEITLGDLLEIFPFEDNVVVVRITGQQIWDALENGVSMVPKQEGRFPIVSGLKVEYNPKTEPFKRLRNVWLTERKSSEEDAESAEDPGPHNIIGKLDMKKTYTVCTRAYIAAGYDGFESFKEPTTKYLIDDENGITLSTLIHRYFIGLYYISAIKFNMSCEDHTKESVLHAFEKWKKLAESKREKSAYSHISRHSIKNALNLSMGETIKAKLEETPVDSESQTRTDFVKDWVTVAPMLEDRIVVVDF
nr:5310_t:CDS:2 [Entrophospora candida]